MPGVDTTQPPPSLCRTLARYLIYVSIYTFSPASLYRFYDLFLSLFFLICVYYKLNKNILQEIIFKKGIRNNLRQSFCIYFWRFYLFIFRGERREKHRERNFNEWLSLALPLLGTWPATEACALSRNQNSEPLLHRPELNPHQPETLCVFFTQISNHHLWYIPLDSTTSSP